MRSKQYIWAGLLVGLVAALFWGMAAETSNQGEEAAGWYVAAGLLSAVAACSLLIAAIGIGVRSSRDPWR